ncbi:MULTISPECIES: RDD family protein [unclassified Streptomyces]|uniref:RDD family protein n=1 Tax=unclassified Streptomyces TaxID=2593676 RepID=UPI003BB62147
MSFGDPNNPYGQQPQQPPQNNPYGQQPPQPGPYPQQAPQGVPPQGYGYPQQQPPGQPYGYPQQQQPGQPYGAYPQQGGPGGYFPQSGPGAPASMGRRLGARAIDGALIGVIYFIVSLAGIAGSASSVSDCDPYASDYQSCVNDASSNVIVAMLAVLGVLAAIIFLYEAIMISTVGATLGKLAVGVRVINAETGGKPSFGAALVRYLIPMVGAFVCYIGAILVYLSPFWDKSGRLQGWHDKAAKTAVVTNS